MADIWALGWDPKKLFRNNGDGTSEDVTEQAGIDPSWARRATWRSSTTQQRHPPRPVTGQYVVPPDERWGFGPICTCSNLLADEGTPIASGRSNHDLQEHGDGTSTNIYEKSRFVPLGMMVSNDGDWNNDGYEDRLMGAVVPTIK